MRKLETYVPDEFFPEIIRLAREKELKFLVEPIPCYNYFTIIIEYSSSKPWEVKAVDKMEDMIFKMRADWEEKQKGNESGN